jgi:hypothetical protein
MHNPAAFLAHCLYQLSLPNEQASDLILREFAAHEQAVLSPRSASEYRAAAAAWNGRLGAVYGQNSGEWDLIWNELLVTSTTGESQSPAARLFDVIVKVYSTISYSVY